MTHKNFSMLTLIAVLSLTIVFIVGSILATQNNWALTGNIKSNSTVSSTINPMHATTLSKLSDRIVELKKISYLRKRAQNSYDNVSVFNDFNGMSDNEKGHRYVRHLVKNGGINDFELVTLFDLLSKMSRDENKVAIKTLTDAIEVNRVMLDNPIASFQ